MGNLVKKARTKNVSKQTFLPISSLHYPKSLTYARYARNSIKSVQRGKKEIAESNLKDLGR